MILVAKQRELLKRLRKAAKARGLSFELERHGGNHDVYSLDGLRKIVPRHAEIADQMAEVIFRQCEVQLGKRWWK